MTAAQKSSRADWRKARKQYRDAQKGFRAQTRRALERAAVAVLIADTAAREKVPT